MDYRQDAQTFCIFISVAKLKFSFPLLLALILFALIPFSTNASVLLLPSSIAQEALSESVPTAFQPLDFSVTDFALEWIGDPIPGVIPMIENGSLEWVRVSQALVVPRARLVVEAAEIDDGVVMNQGFYQPFRLEKRKGIARIPIVLITNEKNDTEIRIKQGNVEKKGALRIKFKPLKPTSSPQIAIDSSCSPYKVDIQVSEIFGNQPYWGFLGCRLIYGRNENGRAGNLELYLLMDGIEKLFLRESQILETTPSVWFFRVQSEPGYIDIKSEHSKMRLSYKISADPKFGSLGLGIGPYSYSFDAPDANANTIAPLMTLYGSYFVFENLRIVAFNATVLHSVLNTDLGLYLNHEYLRMFDRRVTLNIMLGGHAVGFHAGKSKYIKLGAPQGVELMARDILKQGQNVTLGAFIYPLIQGKSYYNLWLRYGSFGFFGELNYIAWHEIVTGGRVYSKSLGLSVGLPLFGFL